MSDAKSEDAKDPDLEDLKHAELNEENPMPSPQQEEETMKKKYGGLLPRKTPLISKDHERAFFDSADWALGKGTQKSKGPLEALRPKLQPTPHQQARSRRSAYAPADDDVEGENTDGISSEDKSCTLDGGDDSGVKGSAAETHSEGKSTDS